MFRVKIRVRARVKIRVGVKVRASVNVRVTINVKVKVMVRVRIKVGLGSAKVEVLQEDFIYSNYKIHLGIFVIKNPSSGNGLIPSPSLLQNIP